MPIVRGQVPLYLEVDQPSQQAVSQAGALGILYIYALTFAGLNFQVFADQELSAKVSSRKNLDLSGNESAICKMIASQKCKNDSDLLWQHDMQLRPPPKQLITSIRQGFRGNDDSAPLTASSLALQILVTVTLIDRVTLNCLILYHQIHGCSLPLRTSSSVSITAYITLLLTS